MPEQNATPTPADLEPAFRAPETVQAPAAATPEPAKVEESKPAEASKADEPEMDPRIRKLIDDVRGDFKAERTKRQEAEVAMEEFKQSIGKAFGLVKDEPVDPAVLTEQLTKAQGEQRQTALELAIYRSTPDAAVANQLLDSRSFLAKVADLDPSDGVAIAAAVGEAVQSIPALGKRAPARNPAQGSSASGPTQKAQVDSDGLARMKPEEIEKARKEGRLDHLLGITH